MEDIRLIQRTLQQLGDAVARLQGRVGALPARYAIGGTAQLDLFPVQCFNGSGDEGDNETAPDFAYDIYDFASGQTLIASSVDVDAPRSVGLWTAAPDGSLGLAYFDDSGNAHLAMVFGETRGHIGCSS